MNDARFLAGQKAAEFHSVVYFVLVLAFCVGFFAAWWRAFCSYKTLILLVNLFKIYDTYLLQYHLYVSPLSLSSSSSYSISRDGLKSFGFSKCRYLFLFLSFNRPPNITIWSLLTTVAA
jgi:hypothetical protein